MSESTFTGAQRGVAALLFMQGGMYTLDAMSALNSSPWTSENFGADPQKAKSCREYVMHSVVYSMGFTIASSLLAGTWWPAIGGGANNVYLYWLYNRALKRGAIAGSNSWAKVR